MTYALGSACYKDRLKTVFYDFQIVDKPNLEYMILSLDSLAILNMLEEMVVD